MTQRFTPSSLSKHDLAPAGQEYGNVFFTLFGAVALIGALGVAATSIMTGPMKTMSTISQRAQAESEVMSNMTLSVLGVSSLAEQDCDLDGAVEALPWDTGAGPTGGGLIPTAILTSNREDPWGTVYGYCVWDHGTLVDDAGCGGAAQNRLPGLNTTTYPAGKVDSHTTIAVISAGQDRAFTTTCRDWAAADVGTPDGDLSDPGDLPLLESTGDDIVLSFNYAEASVATSSDWKIKDTTFESGTGATEVTAEISDDIELAGAKVEVGDSGVAGTGLLDVSGGGIVFPQDPGDDSISGACGPANDKQLRFNTSTTPPSLEVCDGTWQPISGTSGGGSCQAYTPTGVRFDGTNDWIDINSNPSGVVDSKLWTASFWIRSNNTSQDHRLHEGFAFSTQILWRGATTDRIAITAQNSSGTNILSIQTNPVADNNWHHILFSVDLSDTNKRHVYVDGVPSIGSVSTYVNDLIDFTNGDFAFGAGPSGSTKSNVDIADFWMDMGTYIDFSVEANRNKFLLAGNVPIYLGSNGELPTGAQPDVFFAGALNDWHLNRGTVKGFIENGALTAAPTNPPEGQDCTGKVAQSCAVYGDRSYTDVYSKHCYYAETSGVTYATADAACAINGHYLANITSQSETDTLRANITAGTGAAAFFGANDTGTEGTWIWDGGELDTVQFWSGAAAGSATGGHFSNWAAAQPDDSGGVQDCATLSNAASTWSDTDCTAANDYICEVGPKDYIASGDITNGLVAQWKLDETTGATIDDAIGANNGTWTDGGDNDVSGETTASPIGGGLQFNGVGTSITIGDPVNGSLDFGTGSFTYSAWVNMDDTLNTRVFSKQGASNSAGYSLLQGWSGTVDQAACRIGNGASELVAEYPRLARDTWHLVTCVVDTANSRIRIYVNGIEQKSTDIATAGDQSNSTSLLIGRSTFYSGKLDDVRIYNRALNGDEIATLYEYQSEDVINGLAGYWPLDERTGSSIDDAASAASTGTWSDSSGNAVTEESAVGVKGRSVNFDGANDSVSTPHNAAYAITGPITVSAWVNPDTLFTGANENRIVLKGDGTYTGSLYTLDIKDGRPLLSFGQNITTVATDCDQTTETCVVGAATITTGTWTHILGVYDGTKAEIYINGALNGTNSFTHTRTDGGGAVVIGNATAGGSADKFDGKIDEVRVYNRALSAAEIAKVYEATKPSPDSSLIMHFKMDDTSGASITDSAGGNNGVWTDGGDNNVSGEAAQGIDGGAIRFTAGINEQILATGFPTGSRVPFTTSLWVKHDSAAGVGTMVSIGQALTDQGVNLFSFGTGVSYTQRIYGYAVSQKTDIVTSEWGAPTPSEWVHYTASYDGTTISTYRNGILFGAPAAFYNGTSSNFQIGGAFGTITNSISGLIDDVRVYDRGLNAQEVQELYSTYFLKNAKCDTLGDARFTDHRTGSCYYLETTADTWANADTACKANGGYLAQVENRFEHGQLFFLALDNFWIGAHDPSSNDTWQWSGGPHDGVIFWQGTATGQKISSFHTHWTTGHPTGGTNDCAQGGATWDSIACASARKYVCEIPGEAAYPGAGIAEDFTVNQRTDQARTSAGGVTESGSLNQHGTIIKRESDEYAAAAGIGMRVNTTLNDAMAAAAAIKAIRSGNNGEAGLAFSTMNASSAVNNALWLDHDGQVGLDVTSPSDLGAFLQIRDTAGGTWPGTYSRGLLVNAGPGTALLATDGTAIRPETISGGVFHTCGIGVNNKGYCWGSAGSGRLGNGTFSGDQSSPVAVLDGANIGGQYIQISAGESQTCGIGVNGRAYCWGDSSSGKLGNGTVSPSVASPVAVLDGANTGGQYKQICASANAFDAHTCGIGLNNKAYCWGSAGNGRLGNGTTSPNQSSPVAVLDGANTGGQYTRIACNQSTTCGIGVNGKAYCWGSAGNGRLGNGTTSPDQSSPVAVLDGANTGGQYVEISIGEVYACGLGANGKAYCWGRAGNGRLGNGTTSPDQTSPVAVLDGANIGGKYTQISASFGGHTCGLGANSKAYCWGAASLGQLGNGTTTPDQSSPVAVLDGANTGGFYAYISAGSFATCGIGVNGKAYCWGDEVGRGILGNGVLSGNFSSPVAVVDGANTGGLFASTEIFGAGDVTDSLTGYWPMEQTSGAVILDAAGNSDGTWSDGSGNSVAQETGAGAIGSALTFDGVDDSITVAQDYDYAQFTTCAWVNVSTAASATHTVLSKYESAAKGFRIDYTNGTGQIAVVDDTTGLDTAVYAAAITEGAWHHVCAGIDDGADIFLSVDGVVIGSSVGAGALLNTLNGNFFIGQNGAGAQYFPGSIDDVRIYDRALSADEVARLYSVGQGSYGAVAYVGQDSAGDTNVLYGHVLTLSDMSSISGGTITEMMRLDAAGVTTFSADFVDIINGTFGTTSDSDSDSGAVLLQRARGTENIPANVQSGDIIGALAFSGRHGSGFTTDANAAIYAIVSGAVTTGNVPTELRFSVDTAGAATSSSDMVLKSDGKLGIGTTAPAVKAHVADRIVFDNGLRIGDDAVCAAAADDGVLRVNSGNLEYCDNPVWTFLGGPGGGSSSTVDTTLGEGPTVLYAWGANTASQASYYDSASSKSVPEIVTNIYGAVKISAGLRNSSCSLSEEGRIHCWGSRANFVLGDNNNSGFVATSVRPAHPSSLPWTDFDLGASSGCAIDSAQDIYCWGSGSDGRLGDGATTDNPTPGVVSGSHKWAAVDVGRDHVCGIRTDGTAYCWGDNFFGQLGAGAVADQSAPIAVSGGLTWSAISAGERVTCGITTAGDGYCWGRADEGDLGTGATSDQNTPQLLPVGVKWRKISVGESVCGITVNLDLLCWGTDYDSSLSVLIAKRDYPTPMGAGHEWIDVNSGLRTTCGVTTGGDGYCWGAGDLGQLGNGGIANSTTPVKISGNLKFYSISPGQAHVLALTDPDMFHAHLGVMWGVDDVHKLGNDSTIASQFRPRLVTGRTDWKQISVGGQDHTCGIVLNGDMYCWTSSNSNGESWGTGDNQTPTLVTKGQKYKEIQSTRDNGCAILEDGRGYCVGVNYNGGTGRYVEGGFLWNELDTSQSPIYCGVTTTGDGYCWGVESDGEMGNGGLTTNSHPTTPQAVAGGYKWLDITPGYLSGGGRSTCGLTVAGDAYCWGDDTVGQLGNDAAVTADQASPVAVAGGHKFVSLHGKGDSYCGITGAGDAYCWGEGTQGGMGDGANSNNMTPNIVSGGHKWKNIIGSISGFSDISFFCGITTAEELYCWGDAANGSLASGGTTDSNIPLRSLVERRHSTVERAGYGTAASIVRPASFTTEKPCNGGEISFADLYTPTNNADVTTDTITITGVEGECTLSVVSQSPDARIILNTVDQGAGVESVAVKTGDTLALQIEAPGTNRASYTTYIALGDQQAVHTTTTLRKIAFATSTTHSGNLGGIAGADAICAARAGEASLPGEYKAWIGDANGYAGSRFTQWNYGYYFPNGTKLVDTWADLTDGTLDTNFNRDENGAALANSFVWTNISTAGVRAGNGHCTNWTETTSPNGLRGRTFGSTALWTADGSQSCATLSRLYCFEQ